MASHNSKYNVQPLPDSPAANGGAGTPAGGGKSAAKREAALGKFKERISDVQKPHHDDYELHKWLKARSYDVEKAADMYRASMAYKEKLRVDSLIEEYDPPEVLKKYLTGGFCGHDKEGSRVRVELYGQLDMKGLMYAAKRIDLEKTKLLQCQTTLKDWQDQSKKRAKRVDGLTVIFDMEGVSTKMMWRPGLQMYLHLVKVLEDNYPEMMKRMFVVNAPRIFPILYKIARPLISEDMKNKIHVLGGRFKDTLLQYIDAEELPVFLGGVQTDPDGNPRCVTKICQGGEVPREFYLQDKDSDDQLEVATIARGDKLCLTYEVTKPGSVLRWEFKTDDFDIGFGVFRTVKGGEREAVVATERVNSHIVPEDGSVTCNLPATYKVVFDNSFSWARGKRVMYMVEVISPVDAGMHTEIKGLLQGQTQLAWDSNSPVNQSSESTGL